MLGVSGEPPLQIHLVEEVQTDPALLWLVGRYSSRHPKCQTSTRRRQSNININQSYNELQNRCVILCPTRNLHLR